jgi:hypothetical protein
VSPNCVVVTTKVPYSVSACIVWISLKTLGSPVLPSFADSKLLDFSTSKKTMFYIIVGHCLGGFYDT